MLLMRAAYKFRRQDLADAGAQVLCLHCRDQKGLLHYYRAMQAFDEKQFETAIQETNLGLEKAPEDEALRLLRGHSLLELRRHAEAYQDFLEVEKNNPQLPPQWLVG